jgi:hypothetical protein
MRRAEIEDQNRYLINQQRAFRAAADVVAQAWASFAEVQAVAVIGSVAKRLWKEVPRFSEYRRAGIEVWHECADLDLALWIDSQDRLGQMRRAAARALLALRENQTGFGVPSNLVDVFLFEPGTDRYLGRLCKFNQCPKGKRDCLTPGCGDTAFNKVIPDFRPYADILADVDGALLYRRGAGRLRSALDLPTVDDEDRRDAAASG